MQQVQQVPNFDHRLVTTTFELQGFTVVQNLGVVRGIIVRSRSAIGSIGASFQQLFGGNITIYTELCEQARRDAYEIMIQHAAALGANAIIGVRYDATEITQGVTEVLCYGTAVVVQPNSASAYAGGPAQVAAERMAPPIPATPGQPGQYPYPPQSGQ
jgi:uncharacterized protein YbjQ (UPF0145 family)